MILFLKHVSIEGPGTLGVFFEKNGFRIKVIELYKKQRVPLSFKGVEAVVVLGGPMNVYQEKENPFLVEEHFFIQEALRKEVPLLGICLGSQLLAKAAGAKVLKSPKKEIGFFDVKLTKEGIRDPLLKGLGSILRIFQWHEDTFMLPTKARLLAESKEGINQAFRVGKNAYGFQFHVEINRTMIVSWMKTYWRLKNVVDHQQSQRILLQYQQRQRLFHQTAQRIYDHFKIMITREN